MAKKRLFKFALVLSLAYANLGIASGKDISAFPNLRWNPPIRSVAGDSISVYPAHDPTTLVKHKGGAIPGMRTLALASAFQDSSGDGGDENDPDFLDCLEECLGLDVLFETPLGPVSLGVFCVRDPEGCLLFYRRRNRRNMWVLVSGEYIAQTGDSWCFLASVTLTHQRISIDSFS